MLNLKAAKELAAKELGTVSPGKAPISSALDKVGKRSPSAGAFTARRRAVDSIANSSVASNAGDSPQDSRCPDCGNVYMPDAAYCRKCGKERSDGAVRSLPRFSVGDRVEYRSDTHKQWLQGVVQRVRDGGKVYDLDVKKGASANKLRIARTGDLFDQIDDDHDGVISRAELQNAIDMHLIDGKVQDQSPTAMVPTRPISALQLQPPPTHTIPRPARASLDGVAAQPGSRRGSTAGSDRLNSSRRLNAIEPYDYEGSKAAPLAVQQQQLEYAEHVGRDMASRLGSVTVRKMVATTKTLLQGLEGALILRAGFIAGCFHTWRFEVELSKATGQHKQELEQHHDAWASHFQNHQRSFEEELRKSAEHQMTAKEKRRQQAELIIDQWAEGDRKGLLRQVYHAWSQYSLKERRAKRAAAQIHTAVYGWAEGKVKGSAHACLLSWRHITVMQREVRAKEAEVEHLRESYEQSAQAQQAARDREMQRKLKEIEAHRKDRSSSVESVLVQWEKGKTKGSLLLVWKAWSTCSKGRQAREKRRQAMMMQMRKWAEGDSKGVTRSCFVSWKSDAEKAKILAAAEAARKQESKSLEKLIMDQRKRHENEIYAHMSEQERRKAAAKAQADYVVARWGLGERKGTLKAVVAAWSKWVKEVKSSAAQRQAVHTALMKALIGDAKGMAHVTLLNWRQLAMSEKLQRQLAEQQQKSNAQWSNYLDKKQEDFRKDLENADNSIKALQAKAHQASETVLRQWMGGNTKGLLSQCFHSWKQYYESKLQAGAVKDSVLRFILGDQRGVLQSTLSAWKNYVQVEAANLKSKQVLQEKIDALETQVGTFMNQKTLRLKKFGEMLGSNQAQVMKGLCFSNWKMGAKGARAELEAQREQELVMEEMKRKHQMAETLKKERQANALENLGFKRTKLTLTTYFSAWAFVWEKAKDEWIIKMTHNAQMLEYSKCMIDKKFKQDSAALLTSTFAEWHHEAELMRHQGNHEDDKSKLQDALNYIQQLREHKTELQDQLQSYYKQIDLITETLQKELRTKEELATELREAYDKMRRSSQSQVGTPSATLNSLRGDGMSSRASSTDGRRQQKLVSPRQTPRSGRLSEPVSTLAAPPELPGAPTLPRARTSRGAASVGAA